MFTKTDCQLLLPLIFLFFLFLTACKKMNEPKQEHDESNYKYLANVFAFFRLLLLRQIYSQALMTFSSLSGFRICLSRIRADITSPILRIMRIRPIILACCIAMLCCLT